MPCRLHSQCAEELVSCGLPFHGTTQFVRLVQATRLEGSPWEWLKPMQASGAPLPRATLAQRCVTDKVRRLAAGLLHFKRVVEVPRALICCFRSFTGSKLRVWGRGGG